MKKIVLLLVIIIIIIGGAWWWQQPSEENTISNDHSNCVSEPGDIAYDEQCCDNLKTIWGSELPDGSCWCSGPDTDCAGANTCAPCGNNKCEAEYKEDKCSCPEDCK